MTALLLIADGISRLQSVESQKKSLILRPLPVLFFFSFSLCCICSSAQNCKKKKKNLQLLSGLWVKVGCSCSCLEPQGVDRLISQRRKPVATPPCRCMLTSCRQITSPTRRTDRQNDNFDTVYLPFWPSCFKNRAATQSVSLKVNNSRL